MAGALRVLYVDDEPGLLSIGKLFLEREGVFAVDTFTSAGVALEQLNTERYNAIISDYQMPVMDGIAFLKLLKASGNTTPFIIFTGKGREEVVIEALNNGADFYLQKGGEPKAQFAELSNKIRYAVARRQVEEKLSESQKRTADIIEFLPDATFAINTDGEVIAWNRAMENMTGVTAAEILGTGNYEYSIPLYNERRPILIDLVLNDNQSDAVKYPSLKRNGRTLVAEATSSNLYNGKGATIWFTAAPLYNNQGEIVGAIESIRDITDLKRAEVERRESEERYRHVVEEQTELICRFLPDGTHIFVNEAYCRYFGLSYNNIIGTRFRPVIHPDDRGHVTRIFASLTPENPLVTIDQRIIMPDGTTRWQRWVDRAFFHADGSLKEYQSVGRDITDWKQNEEALAESESFNRNLVENLPDYIIVYGLDGKILYVNPATFRALGYTAEELVGTSLLSHVAEEYRNIKISRKTDRLEGDEVPPYEIDLLSRDGHRISVIVKGAPIRYHNTPAILLLFNDITGRKQADEAIRIAEDTYRNIFLNSQIGLFRTDIRTGLLLDANDAVARFIGYQDRASLLAGPFNIAERYVNPGDREKMISLLAVHGEFLNHEARFRKNDGSIIWMRFSGRLVKEKGWIEGVSEDITERKQVEESLQSEQEFTQLLLDTSPAYFVVIGSDGRTITMNKALMEALEYTSEEIRGVDYITTFVPEGDREMLGRVFRKITFDGKTIHNENRIISKSGKVYLVEWLGRPVNNKANSADFFVGVGIDITGRKQAEEALLKRTAFFEALAESTLDGILVVNDQNERILMNRRLIDMWKIPADILSDPGDDTLLQYVVRQTKNPDLFYKKVMDLYHHPEEASQDIIEFTDGWVYDRYSAPVIDRTGCYHGRIWTFRDITERKHAEEALRESEAHLKRAEEVSGSGNWELQLDENLFKGSEGARALYGLEGTQYAIKEVQNIPLPEYRPLLDTALVDLIKGKSPYNVEFKIRRPSDGRILDIHSLAEYDPVRNVVFGVIHDITGRKLTEERLMQSEILLRSMIESPQSIIIFSLDLNFRYLAFNARHKETMKAIWGVDIMPGMNMLHVIGYEGDRKKAQRNYERALAGEHFTLNEEYGDEALGRKFWEDTYSPIYDENHQVIGLTVYVIEITERKRAEELYHTVFENTGTAMIIVEENSIISHVNEEMEKIWGFSREEIEGRVTWQTLVAEEYLEKMQKYHGARLTGSGTVPSDYEFRFVHKNGEVRDAALTVTIIPGTKKSVVSLRDITELKKLDRQVRERTIQVEQLLHQKDEFIAQAGHDLKTPLTPILALLPHIHEKEQDPELRELLAMVMSDAAAMKHLITDILTLAKLNTIYTTEDAKEMVLAAEVEKVIAMHAWMAQKQGNVIENTIRPDIRIWIMPLHLESILDNLIGNAIRYSPDGGTVTISSNVTKESIAISVKDTGIGLTPEETVRIFDMFYKVDISRHQRDSSGLGLSIVSRIAHLYRGSVKAESPRKGFGSTFTVTFPRRS